MGLMAAWHLSHTCWSTGGRFISKADDHTAVRLGAVLRRRSFDEHLKLL